MYWQHLDYLRLVIEKGGYSGAAEAANVSQPAISYAMQALENQLGATLFQKVGRRKVPTDAALMIAERVAGFSSGLGDLLRSDPQAGGHRSRAGRKVLNIGMSPGAALLLGSAIAESWSAQESQGLLRIVNGSAPDLLRALERADLDFVVAPMPRGFKANGLKTHRIYTGSAQIYVRAGHPLASARSLEEIEGANWAVVGKEGTPGALVEEAYQVRRLKPPRILVQCMDYQALLQILAHSDLMGAVPHPVLLTDRRLAIRPLRMRERLPQYDVCLFWSEARLKQWTAARRVIEMLMKAAVE